ncbi:MAG: hypothetical protein K6E84_06115 [Lachnospiraceae bacterium]|nr:hypothetical protein [Lachnospiraceae bacterium]
MKKHLKTGLMYAALLVLLTGCGFSGSGGKLTANGISIDKKGVITQLIAEDFSQSYYNADELKGQIESMIKETAGSADPSPIRMKSFQLSEDKKLSVQIEYDSSAFYKEFNQKELLCGTVAEAAKAGYTIPDLTKPEGGTITAAELSGMQDQKIVVLEEALQVAPPSQILGVSEGITVTADNVAVKEGEETGYILY